MINTLGSNNTYVYVWSNIHFQEMHELLYSAFNVCKYNSEMHSADHFTVSCEFS